MEILLCVRCGTDHVHHQHLLCVSASSDRTGFRTPLTQRCSYPETAGRTLEEIQEIFDGPGAVTAVMEAELENQAVELDQDAKERGDIEEIEVSK
jgi:hypothetical protein